MAEKRAKKLTWEVLDQEMKKYEKMTEARVTDGKGNVYKFKHYVEFPKAKLYALTHELIRKFKDDVELVNGDMAFTSYVYLLTLKHFTDIPIPDDYQQQLRVLEGLVNMDLFNELVEALPHEELAKVLNECANLTVEIVNRAKVLKEMLEGEIQNDELKEQLFGGALKEIEEKMEQAKDEEDAEVQQL